MVWAEGPLVEITYGIWLSYGERRHTIVQVGKRRGKPRPFGPHGGKPQFPPISVVAQDIGDIDQHRKTLEDGYYRHLGAAVKVMVMNWNNMDKPFQWA